MCVCSIVKLLIWISINFFVLKYVSNQPLHYRQDVTQVSFFFLILFFKHNKAGLYSEFSLAGSLIKSKRHSLHYYLPIAGRAEGYIPSPRTLAWSEMPTACPGFEPRSTISFAMMITTFTNG